MDDRESYSLVLVWPPEPVDFEPPQPLVCEEVQLQEQQKEKHEKKLKKQQNMGDTSE